MGEKVEDTKKSLKDASKVEDTDKKEVARKYYNTRNEAESRRRKGERIYYKPGEGY
jgi:hypothetical protein